MAKVLCKNAYVPLFMCEKTSLHKASVCKTSFFVQKPLCVKVSVYKSLSVHKPLCVKIPARKKLLCVKASVRNVVWL